MSEQVSQIRIVTGELPAAFDAMRAEARNESYRFLERLATDWASKEMRFTREGEVLLAAFLGPTLAGIGGITLDPIMPGVLRVRRFYVRPAFRLKGLGRKLALTLLENPMLADQSVTVNAGTADASTFWESLGFAADPQNGHTHIIATQSSGQAIASA